MPTNCGNWAALWHRHGVAVDRSKIRLCGFYTAALCSCSDRLRQVASFGTSAVLLLGIARGVASVMLACGGSFFRGRARAYEPTDCKIELRLLTNAYDCCYPQEISLCDCLQAVNTASSGRLSTTRAIR